MVTLLRYMNISASQWLMVATVAMVSLFLLLASQAEAASPYAGYSTTISHCGWVPPSKARYDTNPRNIRIIQAKLEGMGFSVGDTGIDGWYGHRTRKAMTHFQKDYQLPRNGKADGHSIATLAYMSHPSASVRRCKRAYFPSARAEW